MHIAGEDKNRNEYQKKKSTLYPQNVVGLQVVKFYCKFSTQSASKFFQKSVETWQHITTPSIALRS